MKNLLKTVVVGFVSGVAGAFLLLTYLPSEEQANLKLEEVPSSQLVDMPIANRPISRINMDTDFVEASKISTQSVVYIRNLSEQRYAVSWMDLLFGESTGSEVRVSSGSGVIFTEDGYIVTNNHVIEDADKIEVIVEKETYAAELIGMDPSTDLAVLKIDKKGLPAIPLGVSSNVEVGEWVIAVGNPFNLQSTVTAGIVSAKGRQLNILKEQFPIESFIQTDAAINPGNSGGALVDSEGNLVGINTAILSRTGSYAGYGFAVPVDIVKKVFHDITRYGEVQKAFFGGEVEDFNSEIASRLDIKSEGNFDGVLVVYLQEDGASSKAGLEEGDLIVKIDDVNIKTRGNFEEELSYRSPGDKISVTYRRDGREYNSELVLTNREGTTGILKRKTYRSKSLNAEFEEVSKVERDALGIESGVRVFNISRGRLSGMSEDFVITHINRTEIKSAEKLIEILENIDGIISIEGVDKNGRRSRYKFYGG